MERSHASTESPTVDTFELARTHQHLEGEVAIERLQRLGESLSSPEGSLHYRIDGLVDEDGSPGAALQLAGRLQLTCQRCNGPLEFALDQTTRFRFVADEQGLEAVPVEDDEFEAVIGSHAFNLYDWIEEEAILSLPLVPRHGGCSLPLPRGDDAALRPNPFAVLTALKKAKSEERH